MKHIRATVNLPVVLLLAVLAGVIVTQALAGLVRAPSQPVVATVNLQRAFEGLDHREAAQQEIRAGLEAIRDQIEQRRREIEELHQRAGSMPEGPERRELRDEIAYRTINFEIWQQQEMRKADIDRSLMLEDLYRKVQREAAELARSQGYDMVFLDDSESPLQIDPRSDQAREVQVDRQLSRRRMLYSNESLDITDELITRMNNRFRAQQNR